MWQSAKQIQSSLSQEMKELKLELKTLKESELTQDKANQWWKTIDMNDPFLIKLVSRMYGSTEQRIMQLYIIRDNLNLKTITPKK